MLDPTDFWILHATVLATSRHAPGIVPLWMLDTSAPGPHGVGIGIPPFGMDQLIESLHRCQNLGWVAIQEQYVDCHLTTESMRRIVLSTTDQYTYQMTPEGGRLWEAETLPDWGKYYQAGVTFSDKTVLAMAASVESGEEYLRWIFAESQWEKLSEISVTIRKFEPWLVFPWKLLPRGYEVAWPYGGEILEPRTFDALTIPGEQDWTPKPEWYRQ